MLHQKPTYPTNTLSMDTLALDPTRRWFMMTTARHLDINALLRSHFGPEAEEACLPSTPTTVDVDQPPTEPFDDRTPTQPKP